MFEVRITINCPHCQGSKVVKNGKRKCGPQNLPCRSCGKQFLAGYRNKGADPAVKRLILRLPGRNSGIRDIGELLGVSRPCVLGNFCRHGSRLAAVPACKHYRRVQIDEAWSFVGRRKKGKCWLLYAYCPETEQVLAYSCGGRTAEAVGSFAGSCRESGLTSSAPTTGRRSPRCCPPTSTRWARPTRRTSRA